MLTLHENILVKVDLDNMNPKSCGYKLAEYINNFISIKQIKKSL